MGDDEGNMVFPIWPFKEFAQLCCKNEFAECKPEIIELNEFMDDYLPQFEADKYKISVFPLPTGKGMAIDCTFFRDEMNSELENYE